MTRQCEYLKEFREGLPHRGVDDDDDNDRQIGKLIVAAAVTFRSQPHVWLKYALRCNDTMVYVGSLRPDTGG